MSVGKNIIILFWKEQFHFWEYINGNQTFILDFHRPFLCSVILKSLHFTLLLLYVRTVHTVYAKHSLCKSTIRPWCSLNSTTSLPYKAYFNSQKSSFYLTSTVLYVHTVCAKNSLCQSKTRSIVHGVGVPAVGSIVPYIRHACTVCLILRPVYVYSSCRTKGLPIPKHQAFCLKKGNNEMFLYTNQEVSFPTNVKYIVFEWNFFYFSPVLYQAKKIMSVKYWKLNSCMYFFKKLTKQWKVLTIYRKNSGAYFKNATVHLLLHNTIQTQFVIVCFEGPLTV